MLFPFRLRFVHLSFHDTVDDRFGQLRLEELHRVEATSVVMVVLVRGRVVRDVLHESVLCLLAQLR